MVKRNTKKSVMGKMKGAVARRKKLTALRKRSSVDLGPRIGFRVRNPRRVNRPDGFWVPGNSQQIGRKKKISKIVSMLHPRHRFRYVTAAFKTETASGSQLVQTLDLFDISKINDALQKSKDLLNQEPGTVAGNPVVESAATSGTILSGYNNKMYLEEVHYKLRIANNQQCGMRVEVLPLLCVQNTADVQPGTTTGTLTKKPEDYWVKLIQRSHPASNAQAPIYGAQRDIKEPGMRPYNRMYKKDFEKFWKCLKPMKFDLSCGQNTVLDIHHNVFRELSMMDMLDYVHLEGVSLQFMIFAESILVGNGTQVGSQVTLASSSLMFTTETDAYVRVTQFSRGFYLQNVTYKTDLSGFDQDFGNPETGEIDDDGNGGNEV